MVYKVGQDMTTENRGKYTIHLLILWCAIHTKRIGGVISMHSTARHGAVQHNTSHHSTAHSTADTNAVATITHQVLTNNWQHESCVAFLVYRIYVSSAANQLFRHLQGHKRKDITILYSIFLTQISPRNLRQNKITASLSVVNNMYAALNL